MWLHPLGFMTVVKLRLICELSGLHQQSHWFHVLWAIGDQSSKMSKLSFWQLFKYCSLVVKRNLRISILWYLIWFLHWPQMLMFVYIFVSIIPDYIGLTVIWEALNTFALEVIAFIDIISIWWQVLLFPCISITAIRLLNIVYPLKYHLITSVSHSEPLNQDQTTYILSCL